MSTIASTLQTLFQDSTFVFRREVERLTSEYNFARKLAGLRQDYAEQWNPLLDEVDRLIIGLKDITCLQTLRETVRHAEDIMKPIGIAARDYTIHCVGHAHLDMNWMWSYPETVAAVCDTVDTVIKLLDQYPDFIFSQSQCSVYSIISLYRPDLFARIQEMVQAGRWEILASQWVENDNNLSGSEALCRHILYSRKFIKKHFGLEAEDVPIAWFPDTFGHAASIPDCLNKGKVEFCYLHRPGKDAANYEAFFWEGTDGSRVLVRNDARLTYNGQITFNLADKMFDFIRFTGGRHFMFVYGIGDHGGGPTRRDLEDIIEMSSYPIFPKVKFSTVLDFFTAFKAESDKLPVIKGELNTEFTGCYTSQSEIKAANRLQENRLVDAEYAHLLAAMSGVKAYTPDFEGLWRNCLFQQFHDILPGSCQKTARDYVAGHLQDTLADTDMAELLALRGLAARIDTNLPSALQHGPKSELPRLLFCRDITGSGAGITYGSRMPSTYSQVQNGIRPYVIFNPTESSRQEVIVVTVWDNPSPGESENIFLKKHFTVRLPNGEIIPVQQIDQGAEWKHHFIKVAFPVSVPSYGYAVYTILENVEPMQQANTALVPLMQPHHCRYASHERNIHYGGANDFIQFEIDPISGGIASLVDKQTGITLISNTDHTPLFEMVAEKPHWMSSWCVAHGITAPMPKVISMIQKNYGPYLLSVEVACKCENSDFTIRYELDCISPALRIFLKLNWLEKGSIDNNIPTLRMSLPLALQNARLSTAIPFGIYNRDLNQDEEVPALQSLHVLGDAEGKRGGIVMANDCKYGYSLEGNILHASIIRSSFDPDPFPEFGTHDCAFAICPATPNDRTDIFTDKFGRDFNHPLKVIGTTCHAGTLPSTETFLSCSEYSAVFTCIKKSEDDSGMLVRFYTCADISSPFTIKVHPILGAITEAFKVDLMERRMDIPPLETTADSIILPPLPRGIHSIMIHFNAFSD